jgi:hypothetical protein
MTQSLSLQDQIATATQIATRLRELHAAEPDPDDVPGLSFNQRQARHEQRRHARDMVNGIETTSSLLAKPMARLAELERQRDATRAAEAEIERQLGAWPAIAEPALFRPLPRQTSEQRKLGLTESLRALHAGYDKQNQMPWPLCVLLHEKFYGSLPYLDASIGDVTKLIARLREQLAAYVAAAESLMASDAGRVEVPS